MHLPTWVVNTEGCKTTAIQLAAFRFTRQRIPNLPNHTHNIRKLVKAPSELGTVPCSWFASNHLGHNKTMRYQTISAA
jgi:hypothetical protein